MSCIRFNSPAQRAQMRVMAPVMLTAAEAAALHPAPVFTPAKLSRLDILAADVNPKIREAVASSLHAPAELLSRLAADPNVGVRTVVARNEATPCHVFRTLAGDRSEKVRGFLALNFAVPADVMELLAEDVSATVRGLVKWKSELATS